MEFVSQLPSSSKHNSTVLTGAKFDWKKSSVALKNLVLKLRVVLRRGMVAQQGRAARPARVIFAIPAAA